MGRKFSRHTNGIITTLIFIMAVINIAKTFFIECHLKTFADIIGMKNTKIISVCVFWFVIWTIVFFIIPSNFKYIIIAKNNCIIIELSEHDRRRLNNDFAIVSKSREYIVLDDGFSRVRIPYNRKVLKFLREVQN